MEFKAFVGGPFRTNTYLVYDPSTHDSIIIDPGFACLPLIEEIKHLGLKPSHIILTHGHSDHTDGLPFFRENLGEFVLVASELEKECLFSRRMSFGKGGIEADMNVSDGETLSVGSLEMKFISTPGHTPGGMCIYFEKDALLFAGDTLFFASVGRTDMFGSDHDALISNIKEKLLTLPSETKVFPGHGGATSIEYEKRYNPFVSDQRAD